MVNKNLLLIHGAWCSKNSFNYIIKKVLDDSKVGTIRCFEYNCQTTPLTNIAVDLSRQLEEISDNGLQTVVVGHSLGGLLALLHSHRNEVARTITLASPLAGIKYNILMHWYLSYHAPVMTDLQPGSDFLRWVHSVPYSLEKPIDVMVATQGFNPMIYEPSDGVITLESQLSWCPRSAFRYNVPVNHNEILLAPEAIIKIEKALAE